MQNLGQKFVTALVLCMALVSCGQFGENSSQLNDSSQQKTKDGNLGPENGILIEGSISKILSNLFNSTAYAGDYVDQLKGQCQNDDINILDKHLEVWGRDHNGQVYILCRKKIDQKSGKFSFYLPETLFELLDDSKQILASVEIIPAGEEGLERDQHQVISDYQSFNSLGDESSFQTSIAAKGWFGDAISWIKQKIEALKQKIKAFALKIVEIKNWIGSVLSKFPALKEIVTFAGKSLIELLNNKLGINVFSEIAAYIAKAFNLSIGGDTFMKAVKKHPEQEVLLTEISDIAKKALNVNASSGSGVLKGIISSLGHAIFGEKFLGILKGIKSAVQFFSKIKSYVKSVISAVRAGDLSLLAPELQAKLDQVMGKLFKRIKFLRVLWKEIKDGGYTLEEVKDNIGPLLAGVISRY